MNSDERTPLEDAQDATREKRAEAHAAVDAAIDELVPEIPTDSGAPATEALLTPAPPPAAEEPASAAAPETTSEASTQPETPVSPAAQSTEGQPAAAVPETPDAVLAQLEATRSALVTALFKPDRPAAAQVSELLAQYSARGIKAAVADLQLPEEVQRLERSIEEQSKAAVEEEQKLIAQHTAQGDRYRTAYGEIFAGIDALIGQIEHELARLDVEAPAYTAASPELQTMLGNHRKGIEIIHRMLARLKERYKPLEGQAAAAQQDLEKVAAPEAWDSLGSYARERFEAFHRARDANYHAAQDALKLVDSWKKALQNAVKQVLSAIDGVDSGLATDRESRLAAAPPQGEEVALVDSWFEAYPRLSVHIDAFCEQVGLVSEVVAPGTPFDPDRMDPQGTIENAELQNDDVAAVVRRGFVLLGERIRPILVEVVRNP